ncbi:hypothetical protein LPJ66_009224 [Kickxella alabastrina]|uniref:Uncharacterized protein n=1 Tax=Kickxella alabastrina TaxID=61397 RepID=A0ACC1I6E3_9FUNG|nr:hypothetical protein LPJ66_009224 [Kickxella alabastrina]
MSAFPSTIIRFIPPTVIKDDAEYDKVFAEYYNSGSKPVYRIEYYYPFDPMAINGEPNQYFVNVTELDMCIVLLATQPNFIQYKVNNTNGQYCRKRYEIDTDSGVLFFRNNVLVSYMPGFNFDNFRDNICDFIINGSEFNSARAVVPMSIIFFYNHNVVTFNNFVSNMATLSTCAIENNVDKLYYFRTADVSELATKLHLVLNMGVLFFRNGRLLEYMDDYDKAEFQRIIKLPLTHEFMKEPVTEEMKEIKSLKRASNNKNNAYQQRANNMEEMIRVQREAAEAAEAAEAVEKAEKERLAQANAGLIVSVQNSANHDITYHADGSITINPKKDKPVLNTNTSTDVNNMDGCCIVL